MIHIVFRSVLYFTSFTLIALAELTENKVLSLFHGCQISSSTYINSSRRQGC